MSEIVMELCQGCKKSFNEPLEIVKFNFQTIKEIVKDIAEYPPCPEHDSFRYYRMTCPECLRRLAFIYEYKRWDLRHSHFING